MSGLDCITLCCLLLNSHNCNQWGLGIWEACEPSVTEKGEEVVLEKPYVMLEDADAQAQNRCNVME